VSPRRAGRRPGDPDVTRRAILAAARSQFGASGFDRATIRAIATEADVDPALVHHHFGSKQDLFAAAHEFPLSPDRFIEELAATPRDERAERIVRFYLEMLAVPGSPPLSLLRATATNEAAGQMMREFIESALLGHAEQIVDLPEPRIRIALVAGHMIGVVFARSILRVPDLADMDTERLIRAIVPMAHRYLTDPTALPE